MNEQELNKKLAEWAGFQYNPYAEFGLVWYCSKPWYSEKILPDFSQSLDACFKWLVQKVNQEYHEVQWLLVHTKGFDWEASIYAEEWRGEAQGESPALALCLAIKKLVDSE